MNTATPPALQLYGMPSKKAAILVACWAAHSHRRGYFGINGAGSAYNIPHWGPMTNPPAWDLRWRRARMEGDFVVLTYHTAAGIHERCLTWHEDWWQTALAFDVMRAHIEYNGIMPPPDEVTDDWRTEVEFLGITLSRETLIEAFKWLGEEVATSHQPIAQLANITGFSQTDEVCGIPGSTTTMLMTLTCTIALHRQARALKDQARRECNARFPAWLPTEIVEQIATHMDPWVFEQLDYLASAMHPEIFESLKYVAYLDD